MSDHTFQSLTSLAGTPAGLILRMVTAAVIGLCWLAGAVQAQDSPPNLFDSKASQFNWVLTDNPVDACAQARKDGTHAVEDACSYWLQLERRCTLVTKPEKASHYVLGILFTACQKGLRV